MKEHWTYSDANYPWRSLIAWSIFIDGIIEINTGA